MTDEKDWVKDRNMILLIKKMREMGTDSCSEAHNKLFGIIDGYEAPCSACPHHCDSMHHPNDRKAVFTRYLLKFTDGQLELDFSEEPK